MVRVAVIGDRGNTSAILASLLSESPLVESYQLLPRQEDDAYHRPAESYAEWFESTGIDTVVFFPSLNTNESRPDLAHAKQIFEQCECAKIRHIVLLSSAEIYGAHWQNQGFIPETRAPLIKHKNRIGSQWIELEAIAEAYQREHVAVKLTILRPATVLSHGSSDYLSSLFRRRMVAILPGRNPSIQLLSPHDLARAVCGAIEKREGGTYNVAPEGVIPIRTALRLAGIQQFPVSHVLQRLARRLLAPLSIARPGADLEKICYNWTVSNEKIARELGVVPERSSADALAEFLRSKPANSRGYPNRLTQLKFDNFGMDKAYISAWGRTLFNFLQRYYWRIEVKGLEHVPRNGRAVLVGIHRGVMPLDGIMILHLLSQKLQRYPRFLIHPGLLKFPFLSNFMTKLGGVVACKENGDYMLQRDHLLGIFPEGVRGAYTLYREGYRLGKFGRDEFVNMALRNDAPIIPFVVIGSAEVFPIIGKIEWSWWKRYSEAPFFPILASPLPLPAKWHIHFLPPVQIDAEGLEAADGTKRVRVISREVKNRLEEAIQSILSRRKSIFFGSVF
jgi:1-acyl-sn-glycerol-3-phosphate acyltransferase/nucleoside-diphosphate-sugar epimerase